MTKVSIILAANNAVTLLREVHVLGKDSQNFGAALDLVTGIAKYLNEEKERSEKSVKEEHNDEPTIE